MNDLDILTALRGPVRPAERPADLDQIMAAGRRLRRRRQLTTTALAVGLSAALIGGAATARQLQSDSVPVAAAPNGVYSPDGSWGTAITTGILQKGGEVVITATRVAYPSAPGVTFGLRACYARPDDTLAGCRSVSEAHAPDRSPGFHAIYLSDVIHGFGDLPMFGYYVGPAAKITAKADGKPVVAHSAVWSEDPNVVIWWFPLDQVYAPLLDPDAKNSKNSKAADEKRPKMSDWAAYDDQSRKLPTGTVQYYAG